MPHRSTDPAVPYGSRRAHRLAAAFMAAVALACGAVLAVVPVGPTGATGPTTPLFGAALAPDGAPIDANDGAGDEAAPGLAAPAFTALWTAKASAPAAPAAHDRAVLRRRGARPARSARPVRTGSPTHARPRDRVRRWYARRNLDGG